MKENSYDGKGLKFGILVSELFPLNKKSSEEGLKEDNYLQYIQELLKRKIQLIDFDSIDGLTIEEIEELFQKILPENLIIFMMYNKVDYFTNNSKNTSISLKHTIVIERDKFRKDKRIDEIIEDTIFKNYSSYDDNLRKYANCFLERYRYGTKEETDKKIMEYKKRNK